MGAQEGPPGVVYGTLWSNGIDRLWLYNGQSIWRFDTELQSWELVQDDSDIQDESGTSTSVVVGGAGLTIPSRAEGYYLGGYTEGGIKNNTTYHHTLAIFDMAEEKLRSQPVPEEVPIVAPALVYLDAGDDGLLVVIGGKQEKDGALSYVS